MCYLFDKCIIFLFCLMLFPFDQITPPCVLACLLAVAVSAGLSILPGFAGRIVIPAYVLLLPFFPQAALFLPLLFYDVVSRAEGETDISEAFPDMPYPDNAFTAGKVFGPLFVVGVLLFFVFFRADFGFRHAFLPYRFQLLLLLAGCALAILLRRKTDTQLRLRRKLLRTKDDDTELQLLLKERNRSLLEKQDSEIYTATLRERNRIAREIHDNVGHLLTRAILMVGALKATSRAPSPEPLVDQLKDTLDHAMNSIRSSVHDLHDSSVNLEDSLRTMTQDFKFCPVSLQYRMSPELPREVKYSLIAIAKEALVNISRHSNATAASITAIEHPGFYQFIIQDNGSVCSGDPMSGGLPAPGSTPVRSGPPVPDCGPIRSGLPIPDCAPVRSGLPVPDGGPIRSGLPAPDGGLSHSSGIGLENIRARVSALNGNLQIQASDGFRIYITIPRT